MRKNKSSAKPATLPLFALDKTSKASIIRNRKSAADERLALSLTQRDEPVPWAGRLISFYVRDYETVRSAQ